MSPRREIRLLRFDHYITVTKVASELVQVLPFVYEKGLRLDPTRQANLLQRLEDQNCSHCADSMNIVHHESPRGIDSFAKTVHQCSSCGFWRARSESSISGIEWITPFVQSFVPQRHISALTALMQEVEKDSTKLYTLAPDRFELFVGSVLRSFYNCEVVHVGQSHDGGVDLILVAADDPILVQVKRRSRAHSVEGVDVVRSVFAAMYVHRAKRAMVITTAQRFSRVAAEWIHMPALRDNSFHIELVDVTRLLDMLKACKLDKSDPPWIGAIQAWNVSAYLQRDYPLVTHMKPNEWVTLESLRDPAPRLTVQRCDDGVVIRHPTQRDSGVYAFLATQRDCCWRLSTNIEVVTHIANHLAAASASGQVVSTVEQVKGGDFHELLRRLPDLALETLLKTWVSNDDRALVEWMY
jgi:Restriction endonuclease